MPAEFDPYYTWLGIPPQEQPPHHYRLLGIRALEDNRDVITHAMDQRMAHLRTLQGGKHADHSQRLLNEVSAAAVVLLDLAKKAEYDDQLKRQLASTPAPDAPVAPPAAAPVVPPPAPPPVAPPAPDKRPTAFAPLIAAAAVAGTLAALLLVFVAIVAFRMWTYPDQVAEIHPTPAVPADRGSSAPVPSAVAPATHPQDVPTADATGPPAADSSTVPMPPSPSPAKAVDSNNTPSASANPQSPPVATPSAASPTAAPTTSTDLPSSQPSEPSSSLPTPAEIEAARAKVLEIYGDEAKLATTPEQKLALAQKMMQVARETKSDPAVEYALLDAARRLLVAAGEVDLALAIVVEMADEFDQDHQPLQLATFAAMSEAPLPAAKRDRLASVLLMLIDLAVAEEEFAGAEELAKLAVKVASRSSDVSLRRSIVQKRSDLTRLKEEFQAVEEARTKLAADSGDPAANLVVGKFLCFAVANFEQGVPHLARSGKEPFVTAARADQAASQETTELAVQAGDAWYALADSVKSSSKELVPGALVRMRHWYERALPQLSGLDKARVEKRMQETAGIASAPRAPAMDAAKSAAKTKGKKGKRKGKGDKVTMQAQAGPGLIGRGSAEGRDVGLLLTYQPGHRFTGDEIAELQNHLGSGRRQVEFVGVLSLPADTNVAVHHLGGSASGGVHFLYVDGKEVHAVGDDRTKDETITLPLVRGEHSIRWILTGGELGSAQLEFNLAGAASKLNPKPEIFYSREHDAAARAPGVREEVAYGKK